jgi:hypothetical protein
VQISSLQSSQSLTIHLRACPCHVSRAEWHRHSMSTKKGRPILSQVANRYLVPVVRFAQVANDPGLKVSTRRCGARAAHVGASAFTNQPHTNLRELKRHRWDRKPEPWSD